MTKKTFRVIGMHCPACAASIELDLEDAGIKAFCSYAKQVLEIGEKVDIKEVKKVIQPLGYDLE